MKSKKYLLGIRLQQLNRFTFPVVLSQLESSGLDRYFRCQFIENFKDLCQIVKIDPEGLLLYSFMIPDLLKIEREIRWIKKNIKCRRLKLVSGGPHTSGDPVSCLKLGFDYAFCGAAETGFVKFIERYQARIQLHHFIPLAGIILSQSNPATLDYKSIDTILKYEKDGIGTGWWKKGRIIAQEFVEIRNKLQDREITYEKDYSLTLTPGFFNDCQRK